MSALWGVKEKRLPVKTLSDRPPFSVVASLAAPAI